MSRRLVLQAEHGALPCPFGWSVEEPADLDAAREASVDGSLDKIGRQEGQRDHHGHPPRIGELPLWLKGGTFARPKECWGRALSEAFAFGLSAPRQGRRKDTAPNSRAP